MSGAMTIKLEDLSVEALVISTTATGNSYSWTIPASRPESSHYKIIVQSADGQVIDGSNVEFTINWTDLDHQLLDQSEVSIHSCSSQQGGNEATLAIDGDETTFWHTPWSPITPTHPHEIVLKTAQAYEMTGLRYIARPGASNGSIANFEIYLSTDGINWGSAMSAGTWAATVTPQDIYFGKQNAQYIKLKALSEVNGGAWASAAEICIFHSINLDSDDDGIPNAWESAYSLNPDIDDASDDPDNDGYDNLAEYAANTDPLAQSSAPACSIELAAVTGDPTIRFATSNSRSYCVEYSADLALGSWTDLQPAAAGTGDEMTVSDNSGEVSRFYRLRIALP